MKKLMFMAFVMILATPTDLFCKSKTGTVTFKNNLGISVTLTGPRGSKILENNRSATIMPKTNPVTYTITAHGYTTYTGIADGGSIYTITDEDGQITVN
jgi:hypothetical protein